MKYLKYFESANITKDEDLISDIFLELKEKWKLDDKWEVGENSDGDIDALNNGFCNTFPGDNKGEVEVVIEVNGLPSEDWKSFNIDLKSAIDRIKKYNYIVVDCSNDNVGYMTSRFHYRIFKDYINESVNNEKMEWEKKWEIISFRYKFFENDFKIITKSDPEFENCLQDCLKSGWEEDVIEIYSVKRKSDGEIFTIGDEIFDGYKRYNKISKIWTSFEQMRVDIAHNKGILRSGRGGGAVLHDFFTVYKK